MYRPYIERARELWLRRGRGVRPQGLETHVPWQTNHAPEVLHLALCVTGSDPVTQTGGGRRPLFCHFDRRGRRPRSGEISPVTATGT